MKYVLKLNQKKKESCYDPFGVFVFGVFVFASRQQECYKDMMKDCY